jgi:hypothetical protein
MCWGRSIPALPAAAERQSAADGARGGGVAHAGGWRSRASDPLDPPGYVLDRHALAGVDMGDPRQFALKDRNPRLLGLTSLSWLLPVELSADARAIVAVHYDKAIAPTASFLEYGVEDARITLIGGTWWMTACGVSAERHCTVMYRSDNGLDYELLGVVLDHQNKDMILFEGKVATSSWRSPVRSAKSISPIRRSRRSWAAPRSISRNRPTACTGSRSIMPGHAARKGSTSMTSGSAAAASRCSRMKGWMLIYHGVEKRAKVGIYRSFWALLDQATTRRRSCGRKTAMPCSRPIPTLTADIAHQMYLPTPVVFTTGLAMPAIITSSRAARPIWRAGSHTYPEGAVPVMRLFPSIPFVPQRRRGQGKSTCASRGQHPDSPRPTSPTRRCDPSTQARGR